MELVFSNPITWRVLEVTVIVTVCMLIGSAVNSRILKAIITILMVFLVFVSITYGGIAILFI